MVVSIKDPFSGNDIIPLQLTDLVLMGSVFAFTATVVMVDQWTGRIPNKLTYPFFGLGLIFQLVFHPYAATALGSLLNAAAAFSVTFGVLLVLFLFSATGAGGFKMMAALSVWLGWSMTLPTLALAALVLIISGFGGSAANYLLGGRQPTGPSDSQADAANANGHVEVPPRVILRQAPAIAVTTWIVLVWFRLWPHLV